jgi:short-subunit dehydrogenase
MVSKKVILITGASSGMGKITAEMLAKEGHIVYGAARRVEKMEELRRRGGFPLQMDVTREDTVVAAVNRIIEEQDRIDVLINNAGFGLYGSVEDTKIEDARYQFEVNIFGLARLTQLVTPQMRKQQAGTIINISSMGGKIYTPLGAWYHATKHALEGFSDCLRLELQQFGIRVVIVEPGIIQTEFGDIMLEPMLKRSEGGAYEGLARKVAKATDSSYADGAGSPPELIASTISRAINSPCPKTRYLVGKLAKPLVFARSWLGDRLFDKAVMSQVK